MNIDYRLVFSIKEAVEVLGIGKTKIHELIRDQKIQSIKIGSRRLIPRSAITDFLEQALGAQPGHQESRSLSNGVEK